MEETVEISDRADARPVVLRFPAGGPAVFTESGENSGDVIRIDGGNAPVCGSNLTLAAGASTHIKWNTQGCFMHMP